MWHKLKETFGFKDTRNRNTGVTDDQVNKKSEHTVSASTDQSEINVQKENSLKEPVKGVSDQTVSQSDNEESPWYMLTNMNKKFDSLANDDEECYWCKVTVSAVSLAMVVILGTRLMLLKPKMSRRSHIFVYTTNLSLFGSK